MLQVALSIIKRNQTELLMKTTYVLYAIGHNMYYSVGNGEDISTLNNRCQILLLFHDNNNMFVDSVIMSVPGLPMCLGVLKHRAPLANLPAKCFYYGFLLM